MTDAARSHAALLLANALKEHETGNATFAEALIARAMRVLDEQAARSTFEQQQQQQQQQPQRKTVELSAGSRSSGDLSEALSQEP